MASGTAGGRIAPGVGANLIGQHSHDRNQDATVYVGNLDAQVHSSLDRVWLQVACASGCIRFTGSWSEQVTGLWLLCSTLTHQQSTAVLRSCIAVPQMTEELVWELFTQGGPVGEQPEASMP